MSTEEDLETKEREGEEDEAEESAAADASTAADETEEGAKPTSVVAKSAVQESAAEDEDRELSVAAPTQLGTKRFVYAAYFGGAIGVAFMVSKIVSYAWFRLGQWKPAIGEPTEEIVMPIAAAVGAAVAFYYWKRTRTRKLAEEVADELSKVTWPDKQEVTNSTIVVIVTTALSTIFFALMDRFWGFVTNLVYGT